MQNTLVSIIVPCYKQAHYLNESLQSVINQTYNLWECIIVNDGSPDDTEAIAKSWVVKDDRFKYLQKKNGGLSSARNAGITNAKGEFVLPLDADDVLHLDYLKTLVPIIEEKTNLTIVSCYTKFFTGSLHNQVGQLRPKGKDVKALLYVNQLIATSLYRKEDWVRVGGYDETMNKGFEDWEFWLRLTKNGEAFYIHPEFLFYYRKAAKSMLVNTTKNYAIAVKKYIYQKHSELYISDFKNFVTVMTYELERSRKKETYLQNSLEYRLGKVIVQPFKKVFRLFAKTSKLL